MDIQSIASDPIEIFMINDEQIKTFYSELKDNFPRNLELYVSDQHGKLRIENASLEMTAIIKKNPWKRLVKLFNATLINNLLLQLVPDRKYVSVSNNPFVNILNKYFRGKTLATTSFEFSLLKTGAKLVPHTDSTNKIITLMMYFPTESQEGREDLGTLFYSFPPDKIAQYENFGNLHYNEENFPTFYEDAMELCRIPFSAKGIFGFIKGSHSWHSLPPIQLEEDELRRSLNINVYLFKRSVFSPLYFNMLMRLKLLIKGIANK